MLGWLIFRIISISFNRATLVRLGLEDSSKDFLSKILTARSSLVSRSTQSATLAKVPILDKFTFSY